MSEHDDIVCVILAGGRGKRMASEDCHKVCFPIAGRPAIVRAIDTYKEAGLRRFLIVVGQMSEQVLATVSAAHPETMFVYQGDPRGTGHAALVAVEALAAQGHDGPVMIVMGDKVTRPECVRQLIARYREHSPDMLMSTLPKVEETTAGRVVEDRDGGAVLGVVEMADIRRARESGVPLRVGGREFNADAVEAASSTVNASMYLFRFAPLRDALRHLSPSNAQGELYLTDTAEYLSGRGRVESFLVPESDDLMAFNTPAELLAIEEVVLRREGTPLVAPSPQQIVSRRFLKPAREWLALLETPSPSIGRLFDSVYGPGKDVHEERRQAMIQVVQAFIGQFGPDRLMILVRAPGRINLMGRHVDHRGGCVNVMAINREALVAASPRDDDIVRLRHLDVNAFPNREFRIYDLLGEESWSGWMDFLESVTVQRVLTSAPGDWSHYVRAPLLRLQYEHGHMRLKGMDCMVSGNIPMGAGLSSSSALVVAFAECAVVLNGLDVAMRDFVDLCGEGEWFVGSRGGSADHAAIRTGQLGHVTCIGFFPYRTVSEVPFPTDLRLIIANSGAQAVKSAGARDVFNQRVACYGLAEILLKAHWPAAAGMKHLRDLNPDHLQVEHADIYHALMQLPEAPTRAELLDAVPPERRDDVERIFNTHRDPGQYDLRGAALFGISECMRSERFSGALARCALDDIAKFMHASHDGDRRARLTDDGNVVPFNVPADDGALMRLAENNAELSLQPGSYACSTEAIDCLVDIANRVPGVVGSQLAGAGLGGCMMSLARESALAAVLSALREQFYMPRGIAFDVHVCTPVEGAGLVGLDA
jgi:N-acetylgalactosamine kinase